MRRKSQDAITVWQDRDGADERIGISRGEPLPLGVHECLVGVNLAVFSRHATRVMLLLFDTPRAGQPSVEIDLDPLHHRTGDVWHARVPNHRRFAAYAFVVDGPRAGSPGHRFDPNRWLIDPYAPLVTFKDASHPAAAGLIVHQEFDWENTRPPRRSWSETVIYETHVRGLTIHESSAVAHPGQYLGLIEKIPYLEALGVTAVELMPVQAFDPVGVQRANPRTGEPLRDYWGYSPIGLFAPTSLYASDSDPYAAVVELKTMVRECHRAGMEVILDVVFNHTGEGGVDGPTYNFRGFDNAIYYMLSPDRTRYADFTGCGNTLNCNHPVVRSLVVDCLRHWVMHFHVDGFRFDLASVLGRDADGNLLANPPLLEQIAEDPILRDVKLIAEAWDSGGAFQVGSFPGRRWAEWNCHYRCDVRRFWRGDPGYTGRFASRLCGSADLYEHRGQSPVNSVNFITSHDGFTLNDLVSYAAKHNGDNGEDNRDGSDVNFSDNNGVEGPTDDAQIEAMRGRQMRNLVATLFLSRGVPMLLGGDEFGRTQRGNNNAYCQDNEVSWYNWRLGDTHADLVRFVRKLVQFRRAHPALTAERFYSREEITWLGVDGRAPEWDGGPNRVGCIVTEGCDALVLLFNATGDPARFVLPPSASGAPWRVSIDTSQASPLDIPDTTPEAVLDTEGAITVPYRTTLVLTAGDTTRGGVGI